MKEDNILNKHRQICKGVKLNLSTNKIHTHKERNTEWIHFKSPLSNYFI